MPTIYTGKDAYVGNLACITRWDVNWTTDAAEQASSCVPDGHEVPQGNFDFTGSISGLGGLPLFPTGIDVAFQGVIDNRGGSLKSLTGTILVEETTLEMPKSAGGKMKWTATFGAQGNLVEASSGASDANRTPGANAKDLRVDYFYDTGYLTLAGIQGATLTFRRAHTTYVEGGTTYRKAGNLSAEAAIQIFDTDFINDIYPNISTAMRFYITGGTYWQMTEMRTTGFSNFVVDRETNAIVGYTINQKWNALLGGSLGTIVAPNGTVYYS